MVPSISMARTGLILFVLIAFGTFAYGQSTSHEDEWKELFCSDPSNALFVGGIYSLTYGMKELCKDVTPEIIPDLEAAIQEFRARYPEPFRVFDASPFVDGARKSTSGTIEKRRSAFTEASLRTLCTNSPKKLRNDIPLWGPELEKWSRNQHKEDAPRVVGPRTAQWIDEALLHDGRIIEVHREVAFHFGSGELSQACTKWPDEYSLEAKNPDTGKTIKWSGERDIKPMLLDFVGGIPYLVVMSPRVFSNVNLYGCPDIPFVFLRYEDKSSRWIPIPREKAPSVLRIANLSDSYDGAYMRDGKRQTKESISERYRTKERTTSGYLSSVIPDGFDAWGYSRKQRFRNERIGDDCRPALPRPIDSINPKSPLPSSQNVRLEILDRKNYDPAWVIEEDPDAPVSQWSKLAWDSKRSEACKAFFRPADPNNPQLDGWQSFVNDTSGTKITAYTGNRICDANTIWMMDYAAERGRTVLIKVSIAGDVMYRISFEKPDELVGYAGHVMPPTLEARDGYVYFEWWSTNQSGRDRHVKRAMKVRFQEPPNASNLTDGMWSR